MPKLNTRLPKLCRDRKLAISWHNGKRIYHGLWGSPEADKSYKRFIAALLENPSLPLRIGKESSDVLVSELADAFLETHESRMNKTDYGHFKRAFGYLVEVYGELAVNEFSPKKLKVCRSQMVKAGTLCRKTVNRYTWHITRLFVWGAGEELVNANVGLGLRAVKALREGEEGTFDHPDREAVPFETVEATLPFLLPVYQAVFRILKMTGARPSEICRLRVGDINRTDAEHWTFSPVSHKTARHNKRRVIVFGAAEQAVLLPYLDKESDRAVFSPKDAVRERKERDRVARVTPFTPSQRERDKQRAKYPKVENHEHFDTTTLGCALQSAINEANRHQPKVQEIPHWTLYQLRHAAITELVILLGEEKAAMMTGTSVEMVRRIYDHSHRKRVADLKRQAEQAKNDALDTVPYCPAEKTERRRA